MKNFLFIFFASFLLISCNSTSKLIELSNKGETLINSYYKKSITNGYFVFLVFENEMEVRELQFSYYIRTKSNRVTIHTTRDTLYNIRDYKKKFDLFATGEKFKKRQVNTWREKYYKYFAEDFLDMTNNEKIDLLNRICNPL